jgi:two-component system, OmpR family, response regulator
MQILLIEDDDRVAQHVANGLKEHGHEVQRSADGREGLFKAAADPFDVIILDRMLPNVDGLTILRTIRASGDRTPVLLLSALGDVDERVNGLRAGADDYLSKPFALAELLARIEILGRRQLGASDGGDKVLRIADLELDLLGMIARRRGTVLDLTPREFRILAYLADNVGRVVTRSILLENVWDYHFDPQTNIIDQHVSRLRQKVDRDFSAPLIHTVRGSGYVLRAPS